MIPKLAFGCFSLLILSAAVLSQCSPGPNSAAQTATPSADGTLRLSLLTPITSKSPSGSSFLARLENSVQIQGTTVLPEGSVVEGHLETVRARRMMRPGALRMIFDGVKLPDGTIQRANFVVVRSESKSVKADDEGELHPTISKKRLAFQLAARRLWRN